VDIETIRAKIRAKQYLVYDHAITEAFKDGLSLSDVLHALLVGEIIEEYPERRRCLVYGNSPDGMPVHVAVDYARSEIEIVTTYVPDSREWIRFRIRKLRQHR
jgi:hypothetical protein